ncbi:MAG: helix-hairpin-helix domain-containing protein [Bacilli bacterium]
MKKTIIILCTIIVVLGGIIFILYKNNSSSKEEVVDIFKEPEEIEQEESNSKKVIVDIKGMINNPGVYEVDSNLRVNDVIELAGGLKEGADTSNINLAKLVSDEMTIIIYSTEEVLEKFKQEVCICNCPYIQNDACINSNNDSNLININTAGIEELTTLTGIGDVKAEAIIKYRSEVGKFKTKEELLNVEGIGEALFEKIKDNITV